MWWIDVIVVVFILLFTFVGWKIGLLSSLLQFINSFVSIVIAFFLAKPVAQLLAKIGGVQSAFSNIFIKKYAKFGELGVELTEKLSAESVLDTKAGGMSSFFKWFTQIFTKGTELEANQVPSEVFGRIMGSVLLCVVAFVALFIAIRIVVALLNRLFKKLNKTKVLGTANRSFGAVLGFVKGMLFVATVICILSIIPGVNDWLANAAKKTFLTKHINYVVHEAFKWLAANVNLSKLVSGIFKSVK